MNVSFEECRALLADFRAKHGDYIVHSPDGCLDNVGGPEVYSERNDDIDSEAYVGFMEFRLVYQGSLPGSGNSSRHTKEKHDIRLAIHRQLRHLWGTHPLLYRLKTRVSREPEYSGTTYLNILARENQKFGFSFVPLVNERYDQICSLEILLLRREKPGKLITQGGDIDNRLKTLFDALSVPDSPSGLCSPTLDETPFYCVAQKDSLISEVKVTTDRLLIPILPQEPSNYVHAIINVKIQAAATLMWGNLMFK